MNDMPQRPRQHELETESRRAFESLIPSSWVVRPIQEDYGVDLEVEVFESGAATGLTFRVQLKGTDRAPRRGRLSRSDIKLTTLNYWNTLDSPVLVALYSSPEATFYVRWADSYDRYYTKPNANTITFDYHSEHRLNKDAIARLAEQARFVRGVRRGDFGHPMPLRLASQGGIHGHTDEKIRARLKLAAEASSGLVVVSDEFETAVTISLDEFNVRLALPLEIRSCTFHVRSGQYAGADGLNALVADIMVAVAILFIRIGDVLAAVEMTKRFASASPMLGRSQVIQLFVDELLPRGHISDVYRLIESRIDATSRPDRDLAEAVLVQLFAGSGPYGLSKADVESMLARLRRRAEIERQEGRSRAAGQTLYNIAEIYRAGRDWTLALEAFDAALVNDPTYENRGYYWRARGAIYYELGRYEDAADDYRKALACGGPPEAALLLSDVLMKSGKYADAMRVPVRAEADDYYALDERVNRRVLHAILTLVGTGEQERTEPPSDLLDDLRQSLDDAETEHCLNEIRRCLREYDALDPRLWHMYVVANIPSDPDVAFRSAVVCADVERDDPELWALAACLGIAIDVPEDEIDDLCDSGIRWCGRRFIDAVEDAAEGGAKFAETLKAKVYDRLSRERPRPPRVIRMVDSAGNFETFELP